jgi:hypothetical protein
MLGDAVAATAVGAAADGRLRGWDRGRVSQRWPGIGGTAHGNVDVLEDFAGRDAARTVGGENEIVAFLAGVFAADGIDEGKRRVKLLGGDEEARAISCPSTGHSFHKYSSFGGGRNSKTQNFGF